MMEETVEAIVRKLNLQPHPEGGFYRETYRSEITITGTERQLLTSIYFLLTGSNVSRFHRITSDECWYFHSGDPIVVHTLDQNGHGEFILGNDLENGQLPFYLVPGGTIFGSCMLQDKGFALVSCAVAPGFDFRDFELFETSDLLKDFPEHESIIRRLT